MSLRSAYISPTFHRHGRGGGIPEHRVNQLQREKSGRGATRFQTRIRLPGKRVMLLNFQLSPKVGSTTSWGPVPTLKSHQPVCDKRVAEPLIYRVILHARRTIIQCRIRNQSFKQSEPDCRNLLKASLLYLI